jgi:hypothetical protein
MQVIEDKVQELRQSPAIAEMLDGLNRCGPPMILGGAVRDWIFNKPPRDIDITVDCPIETLSFLTKYKARKNNFGGYKLKIDGTEFDIWSLESTWAFKNDASFEKNLVVVPRTVFLTTDAIAYRLDNKELYENGFSKCIETKKLGIVYEPNPYPFLCVSKALCALFKYELYASDNLKRFIDDQMGRGYTKKSFDKYNNLSGTNFEYEPCMKRLEHA